VPVALVLATLGCGSDPAPPTSTGPAMPERGTGTVDIDGRRVTLHVPDSYDPATPAPLVIALHGYTSNAAELESYLRLTAESDRTGFVYAYPDGSTDKRGDQFWNATDACCDFYGSRPDDSRHLSELITRIQATYRIDRARVYLVGHSNGAFMSFRMACDHADRIAAIATLAGATWEDAGKCRPAGPVGVLAIHGSADETILYAGGSINGVAYPSAARTVGDWVALDRCTAAGTDAPPLDLVTDRPGAETAVRTYAQGCADGSTVQAWTIDGGSHVPKLGPGFPPAVVDFLLAQRKP
jgi:polyhydroxybutyrate depolymerase